ncbi:hypothetical protein DFH07DRAFT_514891 [Mycena maculata]|uniref:Uncharacterized protein n=1 Tax=Mycena maculata TaxID=230809 RepID=A0AAD7NAV4_9AGAR|nr:hypothetical protein DFH07DRAFT_514891 [Mycena maculata]
MGVSIGAGVALILGVGIVFFASRRFTVSRVPRTQQSGGWRSLEGDDESVAGASASGGYTLTSVGHGNVSSEGDWESSASNAHGPPSPMAFPEGDTTLRAIEPDSGYGGAEIPPATSSHGHSSQSHSTLGGTISGSSVSHAGHSDYAHTKNPSSHRVFPDWWPMIPTPPSSYWLFEGEPKGRGAGQGLSLGANVPFTPAAIQDPTSLRSRRPPSSLLNPPSPWQQQGWAAMEGQEWRPSAAPPMPSPALTDDGGVPEGLLRPGLAMLLPASRSTRTLGDDVDYSRRIAGVRD